MYCCLPFENNFLPVEKCHSIDKNKMFSDLKLITTILLVPAAKENNSDVSTKLEVVQLWINILCFVVQNILWVNKNLDFEEKFVCKKVCIYT